jgi:hypothetical protein
MTTTTSLSDGGLRPARSRPSAHLLDALSRQDHLDARTRQGLSNHLPMELIALDALGAPPERLDAMLDIWVGRMLAPRLDTTVVDAFRAEVAADGIDATVHAHLPRFVESPGSEWFHSMIRLAYALDAGHEGQVASALADWATYGRILPGEPPEGGTSRPLTLLRALVGADLDPPDSHADLGGVARQPGFVAMAAGMAVDDDLDGLAAAVAAAHVAGANLATLHLVTGVQAARALLDRLVPDDRRRFARRVSQAAAAGFVAAGRPPLPDDEELEALRRVTLPVWDEVRAAAVASPDVHVTKLVYTAVVELEATGDPLYGWLAAREVGLVHRDS